MMRHRAVQYVSRQRFPLLAWCVVAPLLVGGCFRDPGGGEEAPSEVDRPPAGEVDQPPAGENAGTNGDTSSGGGQIEDTPAGDGIANDNSSTDASPAEAGLACLVCHSLAMGARPAVVDASGSGGHRLEGDVLTEDDCATCHEMTRHQQGSVRLWTDPNNPDSVVVLDGDSSGLPAGADAIAVFCAACHNESDHPIVHTTGESWEPGCIECHDMHDPANGNLSLVADIIHNRTLGVDKEVVFTARSGAGSFSDGAGGNDGVCQVCHTDTDYHRHDGGGAGHNEGADCTACHQHAAGFIPIGGTSCIGCHSAPQGSRPKVVNADGSGVHHLQDSALRDDDCRVCHDHTRHQQGDVRLWDDPNNHSTAFIVSGDPAQLVPFCARCHDALTHPTVHTTGESWEPACTECHDMHDPANGNLSLVADIIHNRTLGVDKEVVFTARSGAGSFSDGAGGNDGVCQVCHTDTDYHRHDGGGAGHNEGADCTACHQHAAGFIPSGGTSCTECHASSQGPRRPVVGEFGLASHHVQGAGVTDADCEICHEQSQHRQGQVRLRNVDDPTNSAAVVTLTGSPLTNVSEAAKLEPFCLACHDGDGAGGAAPFGDGVMPSPINAGLWNSASHGTGQTTCMGDGQTFGCHSTGHGSVKRKMLAPHDASQPGVEGDALREEEGLCYSCHDADGPASSNVRAQFELSAHHNVSAVDQGDGSRVECVSCHDPHMASAESTLIDPDSGMAWAGTGEAFCLTCHDGAPPAGVSFPGSSTGTGFDKSSFAGTTHDTVGAADSCRHCHESHGSENEATLKGQYAVNDNNAYAADDYAACWVCHEEDAVVFQDNAFKGLHKKHVKDKKAPCIICHDAHRPFDTGEAGLVNFDYSTQAGGYDISFIDNRDGSSSFWIDEGENKGFCFIRCHGKDHKPKKYDRSPTSTTDCSACH